MIVIYLFRLLDAVRCVPVDSILKVMSRLLSMMQYVVVAWTTSILFWFAAYCDWSRSTQVSKKHAKKALNSFLLGRISAATESSAC